MTTKKISSAGETKVFFEFGGEKSNDQEHSKAFEW